MRKRIVLLAVLLALPLGACADRETADTSGADSSEAPLWLPQLY